MVSNLDTAEGALCTLTRGGHHIHHGHCGGGQTPSPHMLTLMLHTVTNSGPERPLYQHCSLCQGNRKEEPQAGRRRGPGGRGGIILSVCLNTHQIGSI